MIRINRLAGLLCMLFAFSLCSPAWASDTRPMVLKLQKRLSELGYDPGPTDGIWGERTAGAVRKFQRDHQIAVTGKLDAALAEKLGLPDLMAGFARGEITKLGSADEQAAEQAKDELIDLGRPAVEPLIAALRHDNPRVRIKAADALGYIGDPRAIPPLIESLQDEEGMVRSWAEASLFQLTGRLFDRNYEAWQRWWKQNQGRYLLNPRTPSAK